jgi:hypothetical protein
MPEISRFFGIIITMYHREHGSPHFHAWYSGNEITVDTASGRSMVKCRREHWRS